MTPGIETILTIPAATDRRVPESWIDENGHMNIAHYFESGSRASWHLVTDEVTGPDYIGRSGMSFFTVEHRIAYLGELRLGERFSVHAGVVGRTDKATHLVSYVVDRERDRLACRMELVYVHIEMETRRAAPMPDHVAAGLDALAARHPWLPEAATGLSLRRAS